MDKEFALNYFNIRKNGFNKTIANKIYTYPLGN